MLLHDLKSAQNTTKTAAVYLKNASQSIASGNTDDAILYLKTGIRNFPNEVKLLSALGGLYRRVGKPVEAAKYLKLALGISDRYNPEAEGGDTELMIRDQEYLESQWIDNIEAEYQPGSESTDKCLKSNSKEDEKPDYGEMHEIDFDALLDDEEKANAGVNNSLTLEVALRNVKSSIAEPEPEPEPEPESVQQIPEEDFDLDAILRVEPLAYDAVQLDIETLANSEVLASNDWATGEPLANILPYINETAAATEIADDFFDTTYSGEALDFEEGETIQGSDLPAGAELADNDQLYSFWTDIDIAPEEDYVANPLLEKSIDRPQRAMQKAAEVIARHDWGKENLELLTIIFIENGWGMARVAIEREIQADTSPDEIALARELRLVWKDTDQYWMSFRYVGSFAGNTAATYSNLSWRQALVIIRSFSGLPSMEELQYFLDEEFERWYETKLLRFKYPEFLNYLGYCRLSGDFPMLAADEPRFFTTPDAVDVLSRPAFFQPRSAELEQLYELGIDLFDRCTPKSYYASEQYFPEIDAKPELTDKQKKTVSKIKQTKTLKRQSFSNTARGNKNVQKKRKKQQQKLETKAMLKRIGSS